MIVDTNVLIDLFSAQEKVTIAFARLAILNGAIVNPVILAEASPRFQSVEQMVDELQQLGIVIEGIDHATAFRAGRAFRDYRRNGGPCETILPDFLIGAQAAVREWPILTRDRKRFESYFPEVRLIDPMTVSHD